MDNEKMEKIVSEIKRWATIVAKTAEHILATNSKIEPKDK